MEVSLIQICIILLLTNNTYAIGIDYIGIENKEDNDEQSKNTKVDTKTNDVVITTAKEIDSMYHLENGPFTESRKLFGREKIVKSTEQTTPTTIRPTLSTLRQFPFDMFLDYDYHDYDHVTKKTNKSKNKKLHTSKSLLRFRTPMSKLHGKIVVNANSNLVNSSNANDDPGIDELYNLDPAVEHMPLKNFKDFTLEDAEEALTWYVPEKYSCWELPAIYGRPEKPNDTSEVFLIYPFKLKDVRFDKDDEKDLIVEPFEDHPKSFNEWCGKTPCYGDHTLCLFPTKKYSKMCEEGYHVREPSMWEQKALVNTLNSIRNHVAKGSLNAYPYLPPAANMNQVTYDYDLERMSLRWLKQCLPGPAPCQSLDKNYVSQLECTKFIQQCCKNIDPTIKCTPKEDCFVNPVVGCLHAWYWSSKLQLDSTDVACGHIDLDTFNLAQLLWAKTNKIGCAYGEEPDGNIRVTCSFSPGAPFSLVTKYYCGFVSLNDNRHMLSTSDVTDINFLKQIFNINLAPRQSKTIKTASFAAVKPEDIEEKKTSSWKKMSKKWGIISLRKTYREKWIRDKLKNFSNGTVGLIARLVTRYQFREETRAKCDTNEPVYRAGAPGAMCNETGRKFSALCYQYRDPTPGYRLVAIIASIALFSLILYDLFSGVMRQLHL